jgi:hypothetical protein
MLYLFIIILMNYQLSRIKIWTKVGDRNKDKGLVFWYKLVACPIVVAADFLFALFWLLNDDLCIANILVVGLFFFFSFFLVPGFFFSLYIHTFVQCVYGLSSVLGFDFFF